MTSMAARLKGLRPAGNCLVQNGKIEEKKGLYFHCDEPFGMCHVYKNCHLHVLLLGYRGGKENAEVEVL